MDRNKSFVSHATSDNWEVYSVSSYFILRITLKLLSIKEVLSFPLTLQSRLYSLNSSEMHPSHSTQNSFIYFNSYKVTKLHLKLITIILHQETS